jgi:hypothetical protein
MSTGLTFVSYSRTDSEFAVKLASDLRARGGDVWLDQLDIEAGSRWDTAVEGALGRSARLLVLLTPKSVGSQNVLDEVSFALDEGKTVLPVLVESCAIPMRMRRLQYVDFTRGYDAGLARLLTTLGVAPPSASVPPAQKASESAPPPPRPAPTPEPAPAAERQTERPDPEVFTHTVETRSLGVPIAAAAAGLVLVASVVAWLSSGGSTVETSDPPSNTVVSAPAQTQTDPPAATQAAPSGTDGAPESTTTPPRMAPAGTSVGALLESLGKSPAAQPSAPGGTAGDAGLQALLALTRQFSARESLGDADLEQLANAQEAACPNQPISSPCASAASKAVDSTLTAVCGRQMGAPPPRSNQVEAAKYDMRVLSCQQQYLSTLLNRMHEKALGAIRHIRG